MLKGVHGWKYKTFSLITHLRSDFLHTGKMESAPLNAWKSPLRIDCTSDIAPRAGAGRGLAVPSNAKSSNSGLPGNTPVAPPAQKRGSFGGETARKSRLPAASNGAEFKWGTYDGPSVLGDRSGGSETTALPENLEPTQVSNVQPVAVVNNEIQQVDKVRHQTGQTSHNSVVGEVQPAIVKGVVEEITVPQVPKASPTPSWGQGRTAKNADRKQSSDPSPYPASTSIINEEDFPALGAPSSGKAKKPNLPPSKPEAPEPPRPETVSILNPRVDVPPKLDARREAGTAGADGRGHQRDEQNMFKRGREGGGNYRDGEGRNHNDALGRTLTRILRHQAVDLKIKLRNDGYAIVNELLKLPMKTGSGRPMSSHTVQDVLQAVEEDTKQRFGVKEENGVLLIRANQGHTIKTVETKQLLKPILTAEEIPVCVHGTYRRVLASIAKEGLKRMTRNHVHFASGLSPTDGAISGMRKTSEILIYLDVSKALEDGMKLYISENGVILTEGFDGVVPPKYFKNVCSWPDNKPVNIR